MGWAGWRLFDAILNPKPQDVFTKLAEVRGAKSSGDRWQAAYGLSQSLQQLIRDGLFESLEPSQRKEIFEGLESLIQAHGSDGRLKKYVLLTLGQLGDVRGLQSLETGWSDPDPETRFYSLWGAFELLRKAPELKTPARLARLTEFLSDKDPAIRKISASFLVQEPFARDKVLVQLDDSEREVRWNAAVALASLGDRRAAPVLIEFFKLEQLRKVGAKTSKDLTQLVATAADAARKLGDADVLRAAEALKTQASAETVEGKAILKGFAAAGR